MICRNHIAFQGSKQEMEISQWDWSTGFFSKSTFQMNKTFKTLRHNIHFSGNLLPVPSSLALGGKTRDPGKEVVWVVANRRFNCHRKKKNWKRQKRFYFNASSLIYGEPSVSITQSVQLVYHTNGQNQEQYLTYICSIKLILISTALSQYDNRQFTLAARKKIQTVGYLTRRWVWSTLMSHRTPSSILRISWYLHQKQTWRLCLKQDQSPPCWLANLAPLSVNSWFVLVSSRECVASLPS